MIWCGSRILIWRKHRCLAFPVGLVTYTLGLETNTLEEGVSSVAVTCNQLLEYKTKGLCSNRQEAFLLFFSRLVKMEIMAGK